MKKSILLTESQLTSLIRRSLLSEQGSFNNYGKAGELCISYKKKKDGTLVTDRMMDCGLLNSDGTIKDEVAKTMYSLIPSMAKQFLPMYWDGRFRNSATFGKKSKTEEGMKSLVNSIRSKGDFDKLKSDFDANINGYKFSPKVPKIPTFGEALATYLNVDNDMTEYNLLKKHLGTLGVQISLGKSSSGYSEVKSGGSSSGKSSQKNTFCPKGQTKCSGTYTKCCDSPKIAEAQKCLGLQGVGKWGPNTQKALQQKFPQFAKSFTDADVAIICGKK